MSSRNAPYDVLSPVHGRIEVKTRVEGTDGDNPRVSLKEAKFETADHFMAVRWTRDAELSLALMLPAASVKPLHLARRQRTGLAHIAWREFIAAPGPIDFTAQFAAVLASPGYALR
ncbi:hypothetical protein [Devosia sp. 1635]|uniref:hypothetical protein n=1 Tax=Devosia sp. 1635 TaxID=2726066 RepID=UPI001564EF89|nr:hypothetical protein [Devosia sp. 1635]